MLKTFNQPSRRVFIVSCAYLLCAILLYALVYVGKWFGLDQLTPHSLTYSIVNILLEIFTVALPAALVLLFADTRPLLKNPVWGKPRWELLLLIPVSFCLYLAINGLTILWISVLSLFGEVSTAAQDIASPANLPQYLGSLLVIGVSPALCEEFLFRGLILPEYAKRLKPVWLCVAVGTMFATMHGQLIALPGHLALGIVLCYVVWATRSIWAGVLMHFIQNSMAMTMAFLQPAIVKAYENIGMGEMFRQQQAELLSGSTQGFLSGSVTFLMFGLAAAALLLGFHFLTKKRHEGVEQRLLDKPFSPLDGSPTPKPCALAYVPLVPAALIAVLRYIASAAATFGFTFPL